MGQTQLKANGLRQTIIYNLHTKTLIYRKKHNFTIKTLYSICNIYCLVFEHLHTTDLG